VFGTTIADGILQQRLEYALEVKRRPANSLEHFGGGCLLPQRFAQFLRASLHLLEQSHVLNRDHCLVGEGRQQLNLPVRERHRFGLADGDRAHWFPVPQHGHGKRGPPVPRQRQFMRILRIREKVVDVGYVTIQYGSVGEHRAVRPLWIYPSKTIQNFRREVVGRCDVHEIAVV
jgi:hypothetical protein